MPIETIPFRGKQYPKFQSEGFAAKFAFPFANELCKGQGLDVGCNREEWALKSHCDRTVTIIDPEINKDFHATNLPVNEFSDCGKWDFIFSSHCLEHVPNWTETLLYWRDKLKTGGVLFLYLPHYSQEYWRTWSNKKHIHNLQPEVMKDFFEFTQWSKSFVTGPDLNNSFYAIAEK